MTHICNMQGSKLFFDEDNVSGWDFAVKMRNAGRRGTLPSEDLCKDLSPQLKVHFLIIRANSAVIPAKIPRITRGSP